MLSSQILEFQYGTLKGFFSIAVLPDWVISVEQPNSHLQAVAGEVVSYCCSEKAK